MLHCAKNNIPLGVLKTNAVVQKLFTEIFLKRKQKKKKSCHETPLKLYLLKHADIRTYLCSVLTNLKSTTMCFHGSNVCESRNMRKKGTEMENN